jgi:hypothetical protein
MSDAIYFRTLAARCCKAARDCSDQFSKEEFRRLAQELEIRADRLECSVPTAEQTGWWPTPVEQPRGFEGDH